MSRDIKTVFIYIMITVVCVTGAFSIAVSLLGGARAQDSAAKPQGPVDPTSAQANDAKAGLAELEGFLEPFIYDVVNRRDPFLPYSEFIPDDGPSRPMSPAQRFPLEELRLLGVIWDIKEPKAMFVDPDKEVLMLGRDESIGNRNGYIAAIRESEVVVVEAIRRRGDIIYRTKVLRLER